MQLRKKGLDHLALYEQCEKQSFYTTKIGYRTNEERQDTHLGNLTLVFGRTIHINFAKCILSSWLRFARCRSLLRLESKKIFRLHYNAIFWGIHLLHAYSLTYVTNLSGDTVLCYEIKDIGKNKIFEQKLQKAFSKSCENSHFICNFCPSLFIIS